MVAEIITIGDEILIGQVVDSNSAWLASRLNEAGISLGRITSIGDDPAILIQTLDEASVRADIVLMTGGLGPTRDDKTKQTLSRYFGGKLVLHPGALENVKRIFSRTNRPLLESNIRQAEVPDNCTVLLNKQGTAPGMWFEREGKIYVSLPGVPYEMKALVIEQALPMLKGYFQERLSPVLHRTLVTTGIGESFLAERIAPVETALPPYIHLAYLPRPGMVRLRLSAYGSEYPPGRSEGELEAELDAFTARLADLAGEYVIAHQDIPVPEIILNRLKDKGHTLVTAESCTGGYIAHLLTQIPGASEVFLGSVVAYANQVKAWQLGVRQTTLDRFGAVSRETVSEMAAGAREKLGGDYAIAVSGIMGPGGGSPEKPVGTVWIAVSGRDQLQAEKFNFSGERPQLIERTALAALDMLFHFSAEAD